jgi:hypothetical protein
MQVVDSASTWAGDVDTGYRYSPNFGIFMAPVHVPQGAVIQYIELDACDSSATDSVTAVLHRTGGGVVGTNLVGADTGGAEADGCSRWRADLAIPETVDSQTFNYYVYAHSSTNDLTNTIGAVRVYYQLQVSPPPPTATFNDVPTSHPFFQFVEALAASGITAGCGGGNYCPDSPLTRGQMAVFLSKALGLHWPVASEPM